MKFDIDLLIGTYVADTVNKTEIIRWDTISPSWNTSDPIEESGINSFVRDDNYVYVNAGRAGNMYYYDGQYLKLFKKIPGEYTNAKYGEVYPGSTANFNGIPIFGFSNGAGNPAPQGIYSLGAYTRDYRKVIDLSYPISQDKVASVEIGAVLVAGFDIFVAWKEGANYGVDKIDYSNKYESAYVETMMLEQKKRDIIKTLADVAAYYNSLPDSTGVVFSYSINGADYVDMVPITNSKINKIYSHLTVPSIGSLQIKMTFDVLGNDSPTIEAIGIDIEE